MLKDAGEYESQSKYIHLRDPICTHLPPPENLICTIILNKELIKENMNTRKYY